MKRYCSRCIEKQYVRFFSCLTMYGHHELKFYFFVRYPNLSRVCHFVFVSELSRFCNCTACSCGSGRSLRVERLTYQNKMHELGLRDGLNAPFSTLPIKLSLRNNIALTSQIASSSEGRSDDWIMDSEAPRNGRNMCVPCDIPIFPTDIILRDESSIQATDVGSIPVRIHVEGKSSSVALQDLMRAATIAPAESAHITVLDDFP